jgi:hypothetical protein
MCLTETSWVTSIPTSQPGCRSTLSGSGSSSSASSRTQVRLQGQSHERYIWCANRDILTRDIYGALAGTVSQEIEMVCLQRQSRGIRERDGVLTGTVSREIEMLH